MKCKKYTVWARSAAAGVWYVWTGEKWSAHEPGLEMEHHEACMFRNHVQGEVEWQDGTMLKEVEE